MHRILALAAAAFIIAAPISLAQTETTPETTPPATAESAAPAAEQAAPAAEEAAPAAEAATASGQPAGAEAPAAAPAASSAAPEAPAAAPQGCRTRKDAGEPCACLSDTSRIGTSTAHPDGHNVCVRPDASE